MNSNIWIVDFGSQYTQLITRVSREIGYSSYILTVEEAKERISNKEIPRCLILSGGPQSVFEDKEDYSVFFNLEVPILGICYGLQLIAQFYGGEVEKGLKGEYGKSQVKFLGEGHGFQAWMSHSDHVKTVPESFEVFLKSENDLIAGIRHDVKPIVGIQFHPEVSHTENGQDFLEKFFKEVAQLEKDWNESEIADQCYDILNVAKDDYILCAFSGGVDSLVAATLANKVNHKKLYCFFVDHGLLRPQDIHHINLLQRETNLNIEVIDAQNEFLSKMKGVSDPEQKRKIIGNTFIDVFEKKVHEFEDQKGIKFKYLLQGTLYPDVIESISPHKKGGKSVTIKSHHNVGGLPEKMKLELLEPLKYLFKDEVRLIGQYEGLRPEWVFRHPFPGPGIGVRVLGECTPERIKAVQESDQILFEELKKHEQYDRIWQAFTVCIPQKTVGVKGDGRAYEEIIAVRLVNSRDGMTATWSEVPYSFLDDVGTRITNEVSGITRVVYDITSKPPGTIEWE